MDVPCVGFSILSVESFLASAKDKRIHHPPSLFQYSLCGIVLSFPSSCRRIDWPPKFQYSLCGIVLSFKLSYYTNHSFSKFQYSLCGIVLSFPIEAAANGPDRPVSVFSLWNRS